MRCVDWLEGRVADSRRFSFKISAKLLWDDVIQSIVVLVAVREMAGIYEAAQADLHPAQLGWMFIF